MRAVAIVLLLTMPAFAQTQDFAPPSPNAPDAATLKAIGEKTAELRTALAARFDSAKSDAEVCLKAAVWIVKHNEWYTKDSGKQTLAVLETGLARVKDLARNRKPWLDARGKPVTLGYQSQLDGSIQPYSVTLPPGFGKDGKKYRFDVVLHGRDSSISEVKFIASREAAKPAAKPNDYVVLEVYGRGNNAYRWAGEQDIFEAVSDFMTRFGTHIDEHQIVIRGFSMGGAGTWHFGLHHPGFAVMAPGAGFTVTRGYIKNFGAQPDYIERCLHIYDAADYAENALNIPVVAYSGENDPQIAAVRNVEARLKLAPEPISITHIVAPGLEHKMPPEWWAKVDEQIRNRLAVRKLEPSRVRFVTYTTKYNGFGFGTIESLGRHYDKAVVDAKREKDAIVVSTTNVTGVRFNRGVAKGSPIVIDGIPFQFAKTPALPPAVGDLIGELHLVKRDGQWQVRVNEGPKPLDQQPLEKVSRRQGPIDDAFTQPFTITPPTGAPFNPQVAATIAASQKQFQQNWDKFFRGVLPITGGPLEGGGAHVPIKRTQERFFGDPQSNPGIARLMSKLPIQWTSETLVMNGVAYDAKTHYPVLVYQDPFGSGYVTINTGHTFGEADFKGTNALLYPRLGDWAVMKLAPTKENPHATEVVDAGIFDENWQFEKK